MHRVACSEKMIVRGDAAALQLERAILRAGANIAATLLLDNGNATSQIFGQLYLI